MNPEELRELARRANQARRSGVPDAEVNNWLLDNAGITREQLFTQVKALEPEKAPKPLKTTELLSQMLSGAMMGLAGGLSEAREREIEDMDLRVLGLPVNPAFKTVGALNPVGLGAKGAAVGVRTGIHAARTLGVRQGIKRKVFDELVRSGKITPETALRIAQKRGKEITMKSPEAIAAKLAPYAPRFGRIVERLGWASAIGYLGFKLRQAASK